MKANGGVLEIELFPTSAPIGVQRVVDLVEGGFFTDLPFYDVREGDMVLFPPWLFHEVPAEWAPREAAADDDAHGGGRRSTGSRRRGRSWEEERI